MKIIFKLIISMFVILIITITYLSIFGIETDRFNTQIKSRIAEINKNLNNLIFIIPDLPKKDFRYFVFET